MTENIHYVTYISKINNLNLFDKDLFIEIQQQAICNNQTNGITGFLLFKNGKFFQYFEGTAQMCSQLLETITHDVRHKHIKIIDKGERNKRIFNGWHMNCYDINAKTQEIEQLNLPDNIIDFDVYHWDKQDTDSIISSMSKNHLVSVKPIRISYLSALYHRFINQHKVFITIQILILFLLLLNLIVFNR